MAEAHHEVGAVDELEILRRLVGFDTTSRLTNLPLVDYLAEVLDRPGTRLERLPSPEGDKANLLVEVGPPAEDGGGLLLSGHTDVVPAGSGWTSDPFVLAAADGRWVGRGACDMKGFVALAVALARRLDPSRLRRPLVLLFTYDEEVGTLGAQEFVRAWRGRAPLPRAALVGEPTGLEVVRLHKGHLRLAVTLHGRAAHSSQPRLGHNAVEDAARVVAALGALRDQLAAERGPTADAFPEAPYVTLNVARIDGGTAINVVPDRCRVELGLRPLPGMAAETLVERVRAAVAGAGPAPGWSLEVLGSSPPLLSAEDGPLHRELCALVGQRGSRAAAFASDAGPLQELGLQPVLFGPGSIAVAHRPDEHLPDAEWRRAGAVLERLVERFCVEAAGA